MAPRKRDVGGSTLITGPNGDRDLSLNSVRADTQGLLGRGAGIRGQTRFFVVVATFSVKRADMDSCRKFSREQRMSRKDENCVRSVFDLHSTSNTESVYQFVSEKIVNFGVTQWSEQR